MSDKMKIRVWYKEGYMEDVFGENLYIREFKNVHDIITNSKGISVYMSDNIIIDISFKHIKKFTVVLE